MSDPVTSAEEGAKAQTFQADEAARAVLADLERELGVTGPAAVFRKALSIAKEAAAKARIVAAEEEVVRLATENDFLRASLANGSGPCPYCELPKEEWAKCAHGFPGCGRADDAMLCPNVGASLEADEQVSRLTERLAKVEAERNRAVEAASGMWAALLDCTDQPVRDRIVALEAALGRAADTLNACGCILSNAGETAASMETSIEEAAARAALKGASDD